jgi:hypothetical protein
MTGEAGAERRVRGLASSDNHSPLTLTLSPRGEGTRHDFKLEKPGCRVRPLVTAMIHASG